MATRQDRLRARLAIIRSQLASCCCCLPCIVPGTVQYLDIRVREAHVGNRAVTAANVALVDAAAVHPPNGGPTDAQGDVLIALPVGHWNVTAAKDWYVPEPAQQLGVHLGAHQILVVPLVLDELRYYLHVDADRDGAVDAQHEGLGVIPAWQWGEDGRGAVVLCNNDHDDGLAVGLRARDNVDNVVNGNQDTWEISRIEIRRVGPTTAPSAAANWTATLSILAGNEDKIRVFATPNAAAVQVCGAASLAGPALGQHVMPLRLPGPPATSLPDTTMGLEAVTYARQGFNGLVRLQLTISRNGGAGAMTYFTGAEFRVAPWLMPHHGDDARRVYVADLGPDVANGGRPDEDGNATFRAALGVEVNAAGIAGADFVEIPGSPDRWMQDCMEIGYSVLPQQAGATTRQRIDAALQARRDFGPNDLKAVPGSLLDQDFGYQPAWGLGGGTTFDSMGNLECTPPCRAGAGALPVAGVACAGKAFQWGRIYYGSGRPGHSFNPAMRAFLESQVVQAPLALDTDWLDVGHVDEMMSFIPLPAGAPWPALGQWRLLMASPARAYNLIDQQLLANPLGNDVVLNGRQLLDEHGIWQHVQSTVATLAGGPTLTPLDAPRRMYDAAGQRVPTGAKLTAQQLRDYNLLVIQPRLTAIINQLAAEIGVVPGEVIEVPVIFLPGEAARIRSPGGLNRVRTNLAAALTGDMVNMLVINNRCVVPAPFGPIDAVTGLDVFRTALQASIGAVNGGLAVNFVDDWYPYHANLGEIHCGTNTNRHPINLAAWLQSPAAEWWRFAG